MKTGNSLIFSIEYFISVSNYISLVINNINAFLRVVDNKIAPNLFAVKLPDECCPLKVQQRNGQVQNGIPQDVVGAR